MTTLSLADLHRDMEVQVHPLAALVEWKWVAHPDDGHSTAMKGERVPILRIRDGNGWREIRLAEPITEGGP